MPSAMRENVNGEVAGTVGVGEGLGEGEGLGDGATKVVTVRLSNPIPANTPDGVTVILVTSFGAV